MMRYDEMNNMNEYDNAAYGYGIWHIMRLIAIMIRHLYSYVAILALAYYVHTARRCMSSTRVADMYSIYASEPVFFVDADVDTISHKKKQQPNNERYNNKIISFVLVAVFVLI